MITLIWYKRVIRAAIHIPVGVIAALAVLAHWSISINFTLAFLAYEITEDWRIKDRGFHDILGFLIGLALGAAWLSIYAVRY